LKKQALNSLALQTLVLGFAGGFRCIFPVFIYLLRGLLELEWFKLKLN